MFVSRIQSIIAKLRDRVAPVQRRITGHRCRIRVSAALSAYPLPYPLTPLPPSTDSLPPQASEFRQPAHQPGRLLMDLFSAIGALAGVATSSTVARGKRLKGLLASGLTTALLLTACSPSAASRLPDSTAQQERTELVIFAASSLTEPFTELGRRFTAENPTVKVTFSFGGSQLLRAQLEQGARADVFASASRDDMERAQAAGLVTEPRIFAHNQMVVILPKSNPARIASLQDLARPGLKLVLAHRNVPVGVYTLASLDKMAADPSFGADFKRRVLANVKSEEDNVKEVVAKVVLGEADGGIVYSTDVTPKVKSGIATIAIPDRLNVVADYPIAVARDSRRGTAARAFVDFVLSSQGQDVLANQGFIAEGTSSQ